MKFYKVQYPVFVFFMLFSLNLFAQNTRQTILFNDNWKFYKGDIANADQTTFDDKAWRNIMLPHDWSIEGPFDEQWASSTAYLPTGIGWYRKTFTVQPDMRNKKVSLYFDGIYKNSEVWINGHSLGKRPNGFIPFQYEITQYINKTGKNIVAVKADHTEFGDSRWYTGSGIYRNVYLIATNDISVDVWGIAFSTPEVSAENASVNVNVSLTNYSVNPAGVLVNATLFKKGGQVVGSARQVVKVISGEHQDAKLTFGVAKPLLWSVEHPELYKLEVSLTVNGKKTDDVVQEVGIRTATFDKDKGFFLNGKSLKLKGVCIHDDAGALGVAVPEAVWERRLKILKEGGTNSLRLSHNPHADYLYNLCDKLGLLVMDEAFDEWEIGKNKWIKGWNIGKPGNDGYHQYFREWADRDLGDMVKRDRNHPSIILWSIGNEIDYPNDPYTNEVLNTGKNPQIYGKGFTAGHPLASLMTPIAKRLVAVVKQFDTTRPVTAALAGVVMSNEVGYPEELDIVGYNYQEFRYADDHKKYPNRIIYGSENGSQLEAWNAVADNEYISGQYLWTGVDYLGEAHQWPGRSSSPGLIDLAGFKKPAYYFRESLWSDKPMAYLCTEEINDEETKKTGRGRITAAPTWNWLLGKPIKVSCYTNCDEAELFLNGKSIGKKDLATATGRVINWEVPFSPGALTVKGYKNGKPVSEHQLVTAGKAYAIKASADISAFARTKSLAQVVLDITDQKGTLVFNAENEVSVKVEGPAELIGLESGSSTSHEDYKAAKRNALHGKLLAYIQWKHNPGTVKITLSSPGLLSKTITLNNK